MTPLPVTLSDVRAAADRIRGAIVRTPCLRSETLSRIFHADIWIKFENLQFTASFKERGALNTLLQLTADERARGVIAMSAGNHAQGVAYHAGRLGIPATIVMPSFTPNTKVSHTRAHGATVVLHGETLAEAAAEAHRLAAARDLVFVHPYDDARIIAGQGTIALEMLEDAPQLDTLVIPVGGGGLIAGCAAAARGLNPGIKVIGAEAAAYSAMRQLLAGQPVSVGGDTLAEGIAVRDIGELTLGLARALVDHVVSVDEVAIERAISLLLEVEKTVVEGAGAAGLAALVAAPDSFAGRKIGLVLSGGNIDTRLLASVLLRGLVRDGRIVRLRCMIGDLPGQLARVAGLIGKAGGNIVEVQHQRLFGSVVAKRAELDVTVETRDREHVKELVKALEGDGFAVRVLEGADI
ncbi:threonine dehydratase [Enhydrobacter aerosaccus]|uniref:Threonine dehydratase n=1 Tax=Enhydrobacter aerosaccus TaxID=225324 RepID=A0A1T4QSS0_9HYPH|nr:threonine ammonia-lyase [Enhydrobacter aerosaccus]SKA06716.1 threonine dehydratase [Enhydrobacter aerosaccus]